MKHQYIVTSSFGNDSVALIQWMYENKPGQFCVLYNDTGWARNDWPKRVADISKMCFELGIHVHQTKSLGMAELVKRKKGWPMPASSMQFCTQDLKERPSLDFYQKIDPTRVRLTVDGVMRTTEASASEMVNFNSIAKEKDKSGKLKHKTDFEVACGAEITIVTGRRREESQNRKQLPIWQYESLKHGGRDVYNPLANHTESQRDELLSRFGIEPLPHSSMECYPCVCANKQDLAKMPLDDPRVDFIEELEIEMGHTRNGKPRTMFRPYRVGGGVGIRQAIAWGRGERGFKSEYVPNEYKKPGQQTEMFEGVSDVAYEINTREGREFAKQCDGGFCGS